MCGALKMTWVRILLLLLFVSKVGHTFGTLKKEDCAIKKMKMNQNIKNKTKPSPHRVNDGCFEIKKKSINTYKIEKYNGRKASKMLKFN